MGPRRENIAKRLRRRRDDDERGAELIEFAIVVVLLITLLYGIVTYGLILSAQATITQAAADAARSGIVTASTAVATAEAQACTDVGWMNKTCGTPRPPSTPRTLHLLSQSRGRRHRLCVHGELPVERRRTAA